MTDSLPSPYADLASWLDDIGFSQTASEASRAFGDRWILFARQLLEGRFSSDRGEWNLEIRRSDWGSDDWFEPDVWQAHLQGHEPPDELITRDEEARILRTDLERIAQLAARADESVLSQLRALQESRVMRGLGFHLDTRPEDVDEG